MNYGYALHDGAENWHNIPGAPREEAAANAFNEISGDIVYTCECEPPDGVLHALTPNAGEVIEQAEEHRSDNGEPAGWWEDALYQDGAEAIAALQKLLDTACEKWLEAYPIVKTWQATNIQEHKR